MENFSQLDVMETEVMSKNDEKTAEKKAKLHEMSKILKQSLQEDPTLIQRIRSLSNNLVVVKTLGYGDSGGLIIDESTKHLPKEEWKRIPTAAIVGYRLQNVGNTPLKYLTEEYVKNEEGVFIGTKVEKVVNPGEQFDLTRKYMTRLGVEPEYSLAFGNGKLIRGSAVVKKASDVDAELEAFYFAFYDRSIKVNSDSMKINIAVKKKTETGDVKWIVKPEFETTFGFLNNEKPAGDRRGKSASSGTKITAQDVMANYLKKIIEEKGM